MNPELERDFAFQTARFMHWRKGGSWKDFQMKDMKKEVKASNDPNVVVSQPKISAKFTRGPLTFKNDAVWTEDGRKVAELWLAGTEHALMHTGVLFAAAPDLYAALETVLEGKWCDCPSCNELRTRAVAALKRARGEA